MTKNTHKKEDVGLAASVSSSTASFSSVRKYISCIFHHHVYVYHSTKYTS